MTKKELHEALWDKLKESHGCINGAKTSREISAENTMKLLELSGDMSHIIVQYVFDVLPISVWNRVHVVASLRRAAKLIESTLSEDEKCAVGELEQFLDNCFSASVISVLGDIRDET